jgi:hypothetical protein
VTAKGRAKRARVKAQTVKARAKAQMVKAKVTAKGRAKRARVKAQTVKAKAKVTAKGRARKAPKKRAARVRVHLPLKRPQRLPKRRSAPSTKRARWSWPWKLSQAQKYLRAHRVTGHTTRPLDLIAPASTLATLSTTYR